MEISGMSTLYSDYAKSAATDSKLSSLQNKLNGEGIDTSDDEELMDVCKEFESYFLEQMYKAMLDTIPTDEDEDNYASKMVDSFKDTAIQSLAEQTTEQGGFGIAQKLYEQMKNQYGNQLTAEEASKLQEEA